MKHAELAPPEVLTPKQSAFHDAFVDRDSDSWMNATRSMKRANPALRDNSAAVAGCRMLHEPLVRKTIVETLEKAGIGIEDRADLIAKIAHHKDVGRIVSRTIRTSGGAVETTVEHGPAYKDVLKALDLASKSDGTYERNRAEADVAKEEYLRLSTRFFGDGKGGGLLPRKVHATD